MGVHYMTTLKQMGAYFSLIGQSNKPLYKEQSFSPEDADLIDELMINGVRMDNDFFNDNVHWKSMLLTLNDAMT